jgi:hypothetical protein
VDAVPTVYVRLALLVRNPDPSPKPIWVAVIPTALPGTDAADVRFPLASVFTHWLAVKPKLARTVVPERVNVGPVTPPTTNPIFSAAAVVSP